MVNIYSPKRGNLVPQHRFRPCPSAPFIGLKMRHIAFAITVFALFPKILAEYPAPEHHAVKHHAPEHSTPKHSAPKYPAPKHHTFEHPAPRPHHSPSPYYIPSQAPTRHLTKPARCRSSQYPIAGCEKIISTNGQCGGTTGATCLGSGFGNCCGYVNLEIITHCN